MFRNIFLFLLIFLLHNTKGLCAIDPSSLSEAISSKISQQFGYNNLIIKPDTSSIKKFQNVAVLDIVSVENGKFTAKILLNGATRELNGTCEEGVAIPVLLKKINKGTTIEEADIYLKILPEKTVKNNIFTDKNSIIGLVANKTIFPNSPIKINNVKKLIVIKKGNVVNLKFLKKNLSIEATGISMDNGAIGDLIKIKVANTNKIIAGVVKDSKNVLINE